MPDGVAAELPGILELRELDGLDRPGCEQVLALSEADPDVDGGQLAFKVAEFGLDVPGYGRETAGEDLPGFAGQRPVPEPFASLLVVHLARRGVQFGSERVQSGLESAAQDGFLGRGARVLHAG